MPSKRTQQATELMKAEVDIYPHLVLAYCDDRVTNDIYELWVKNGSKRKFKINVVYEGRGYAKVKKG
ncbi:MAG: hypothetical protein CMB80_02105 [Flammeovirgaceae bacterium]|nr:hypothetical protein [Flammeovirgaceae bacterium]|tara:strand:- start:1254 stop:1454 length:201 start_codon:yes stop_codon:yes gene_type:complete